MANGFFIMRDSHTGSKCAYNIQQIVSIDLLDKSVLFSNGLVVYPHSDAFDELMERVGYEKTFKDGWLTYGEKMVKEGLM